jgi:hypothetical protein
MKKKLINILFICALFASCTDLNDVVFSDIAADKYPENDVQAQLVTNNAYKELKEGIEHGWWNLQTITGDLIVAPTRGKDWDDGGKWRVLHTHQWTNNIESINDMWRSAYNGVTECNKAIEYLGTSESAKRAVSQMKVLRAYYYYTLIDNYGDCPYITSFTAAPEKPTNEKRAVIYNNIVKEVEASLVNLKEVDTKTSVNKFTAYALLAKLYINQEIYTGTANWAKAKEYCDKVIAGPYSLEANRLDPFITENQNSTENIFTIPFDEDNYQGFLIHRITLHYNMPARYNAKTTFWNGFCAQPKLVDMFDATDTRKSALIYGQQYAADGTLIKDESTGDLLIITKEIEHLSLSGSDQVVKMSGARLAKFEVKKGVKDNLSNDFPIFRLADFMLMKAECELRISNNAAAARPIINEIRTKAGATAWDVADITLDNLLAERGRELWCEGHRRQDLIRFGKFNNSWWEKSTGTKANETFPIPQWAIDANSNLAK